jgi:hypothetical protein
VRARIRSIGRRVTASIGRCSPTIRRRGISSEGGVSDANRFLSFNPEARLAGLFHLWRQNMADYFEQTVVQQIIPDADMTPLERLLLSRIFDCESDRTGWHFFAWERPSLMIFATRAELEEALASAPDIESAAHLCVTEQLAAVDAEASHIDLDLSETSWEFFFQDIVKRSRTLAYITVVAAFTCTKMRPDGFGGMATLITRDAIIGRSTGDFLRDLIAEAGLDGDETPEARTAGAVPASSPAE